MSANILIVEDDSSLSEALKDTLELVGQMAIPLMLITLGVALARLKADSFGRAFGLSLFKVVLCVGLAIVGSRNRIVGIFAKNLIAIDVNLCSVITLKMQG